MKISKEIISLPLSQLINDSMAIVERIQKQLDAGNYTAGVFVDLKKAFDTVNQYPT